MGKTQSKSKQTVINNKDLGISQDEYNTVNQSCTATQSARNVMNISNIKDSSLTLDQTNELDNLCKLQTVLKSTKDAKALSTTMTALEATQSTEGGIFAAESNNEQTIKNNIKIALSQDAYNTVRQNCILNQNTDNIMNVSNIKGSNINASQTNALFNECLLDYATENNLTAGFKEELTNKVVADQKTVAGGLFGGGFMMVVVIIVVLMMVMMGSGGSSGKEETTTGEMIMYMVLGFFLLLAIGLGIYGAYYYFKEPEQFVLDGTNRIDRDEVLKQAGIRPGYEGFSIKQSQQAKYFGNNSIKNLKRNSIKNLVNENFDEVKDRLNTYPGGPGSNSIPVTKKSYGFGSTNTLMKAATKTLDENEGFRYALQDTIFGNGTILKLRMDAERQLKTPSASKTN